MRVLPPGPARTMGSPPPLMAKFVARNWFAGYGPVAGNSLVWPHQTIKNWPAPSVVPEGKVNFVRLEPLSERW